MNHEPFSGSWPNERDLREIGVEETNGDWLGHESSLPAMSLPYAWESVSYEGEQKLVDDRIRCTLTCRTFNGVMESRPVTIESSCFIGAGVFIWPGVRIGAGSSVLPGTVAISVVSLLEEIKSLIDCLQDIGPAALVFGNPQQSVGLPSQVSEAPW
ncbi:hypothetical protein HYQ46_002179 [Verticillium longisporum]|nr:hypothetical protein HYQ46_002179 [Verticillium longisporum]